MRRILLIALAGTFGLGGAAAQEAIPAQPPQLPPLMPSAPPDVPPSAPEAVPAATPPADRLPDRFTGVPGTWDLSRDGTNRRCVMTLGIDNGPVGRKLAFPAGCRRALPITATMVGWLYTEGGVRLVDKDVRPLLIFTARPDRGSYGAKAESGEVYSFVPLDIAAMRPPAPDTSQPSAATPPEAAPPSAGQPSAGQAAAAAIPAPAGGEPAPGLYALDRYRDRDVCRLELASGGNVTLLPGCRDSGVEVFGPATWSFGAGRLTLKARRGHTVGLVPTGEGAWRRDPETGTTFILRRVEP
ncbi:hypothetical protein GCM10007886_14440 [Methylobacterium gregans]|uniref:Alkaline proteinase inhibitor/ Outer membrane lipoprotein Omp19 domain-containing protein n=1 Tax=Methylobacterium gregans TaxID=374424 RepID=A0AA37MAZ1_9HYPH|nr:AprI/Inh family metalloprotease inhibitor [Methylobacterium gregans]MDQ0520791.1 hypothetical protein [Methylobacterium gregans]GJD78314.1 hypothetical protein NBEOAGPD_1528 [Methylobacterium gregans]GLS53261.1 hypothetical protein GCM10007886_14440 [Methylobacterium gregans]